MRCGFEMPAQKRRTPRNSMHEFYSEGCRDGNEASQAHNGTVQQPVEVHIGTHYASTFN